MTSPTAEKPSAVEKPSTDRLSHDATDTNIYREKTIENVAFIEGTTPLYENGRLRYILTPSADPNG